MRKRQDRQAGAEPAGLGVIRSGPHLVQSGGLVEPRRVEAEVATGGTGGSGPAEHRIAEGVVLVILASTCRLESTSAAIESLASSK